MNKRYARVPVLIIASLLTVSSMFSFAQDDKYTSEQINAYKENVQSLVEFLEYSFNTLGNPETSARDKDVIINQTYEKIFIDEKVQVEDDLDDSRETLINKDVQAYLKDIDFFFREAVFALNVTNIKHQYLSDGRLFFTVALTRTLNAKTVTGDTVSSIKERFIEVNYDEENQDLRIASIYTTKIDEREEMFTWWNNMPPAWRKVIGHEAVLADTFRLSYFIFISDTMAVAEYLDSLEMPVDTFISYGQDTLHISETELTEAYVYDTFALEKNVAYRLLQRIASETEIDISGNLNIRTLGPLSEMGELKKVNCSQTMVSDLHPLRNLIKMEYLNCSGTAVTSIAPLQYSITLRELDLHSTMISDAELISNLRNLESINISNTPIDSLQMLSDMMQLSDLRCNNTFVDDLGPLSRLGQLRIINLSGTYVKDLSPISGLKEIERLYISNTPVIDLGPLSELDKLQTIYLDSTHISNIEPLSGLQSLEKIYCDNTGITSTRANRFMAANPGTLVIYESIALTRWWNDMPESWKRVFSGLITLEDEPTKEQLHKAIQITEIDISGNTEIKTLEPLKQLSDLTKLNCSHTAVDNLRPIADHIDLRDLDCSFTQVSNCYALKDLMNLEYLNISHTNITDIECLSRLKHLKVLDISSTETAVVNVFGKCNMDIIYADATGVSHEEVLTFRKVNPEAVVIYQTEALEAWWYDLNQDWKNIFKEAAELNKDPGKVELQRIVDLEEVDLLQNKSLGSLEPLQNLRLLRVLRMNDTQIADLTPLENMTKLEILIISNNPIEDLNPLSGLVWLKQLEFKNTPVSDLSPLSSIFKLEKLDMAGTQIKKLNDISSLVNLKEVSFYNTGIKSLSPLEGLIHLEHIKCYNTKLNEKKVRKFGDSRPNCEIIFY